MPNAGNCWGYAKIEGSLEYPLCCACIGDLIVNFCSAVWVPCVVRLNFRREPGVHASGISSRTRIADGNAEFALRKRRRLADFARVL